EPVSMLDVSVRIGILNLFDRLKQEQQIAWLYITHDLASARYIGDRILVLYAGRLVEEAPSAELLAQPAHPYTRLLLASVPQPPSAAPAAGAAPAPRPERQPPAESRCPLAAACPQVMDVCHRVMPGSVRLDGGGHFVRCHLYGSGEPGAESAFTVPAAPGAAR